MNEPATSLYLKIDERRELRITLETRVYNGIDSDPQVLVREPTMSEVFALAGKITADSLCTLPIRPEWEGREVREQRGSKILGTHDLRIPLAEAR